MRELLKNKLWLLSSAALLVLPLYTWRRLIKSYRKEIHNYENDILFHNRHNCVVMYSPKKGMSGWPPNTGRVKPKIVDGIGTLFEPIIYFINTATQTLDIAMMILSFNGVLNALVEANKRGVKIRLLLNYNHAEGFLNNYRKLIKEGKWVLNFFNS